MNKFWRAIVKIVGVLAVIACIVILSIPAILYFYFRRFVYVSVDAVTDDPVTVMVLGAGVAPNDTPTMALQERLDAATALYQKKNVTKIIVSGAQDTNNYNEPRAMKNTLIKSGVNGDIIVEDPGGYRTFDSCKRAKDVFHTDSLLIVSQGFHLPRALYLCNAMGIKVTGLYATGQFSSNYSKWYTFREIAAMYLAVWDVFQMK